MSYPKKPSADEALIADPASHFDAPANVVNASLPQELKRRILRSWELDARRLQESTGENMLGGERSNLEDVAAALRRLEERERRAE